MRIRIPSPAPLPPNSEVVSVPGRREVVGPPRGRAPGPHSPGRPRYPTPAAQTQSRTRSESSHPAEKEGRMSQQQYSQ